MTVHSTPEQPIQIEKFLKMSPGDFEAAMASLFGMFGYTAEATQISADGGIDIWATDPRPIVGGRVIAQCKRYQQGSNIGEPVLRDLFGLMHAHGVSKGVIITTSSFTAAAKKFATGKPLELIDGQSLISLVRQCGQAGQRLPESWKKPARRVFYPYPSVLADLDEWNHSFLRPAALRFSVTGARFLAETMDLSIEIDPFTRRPTIESWDATSLCIAIDHLKAEYVLLEGAYFRPGDNNVSPSQELLNRLQAFCAAFELSANKEEFKIEVEDYTCGNPTHDCGLSLVQEDIEKWCIRPWWKGP